MKIEVLLALVALAAAAPIANGGDGLLNGTAFPRSLRMVIANTLQIWLTSTLARLPDPRTLRDIANW